MINSNWYKSARTKILYIMRGCSGSGKSTKARQLPGVIPENIFSTDELIATNLEDYNKFFKMIEETGNWGLIADKHRENIARAEKAMQENRTPLVIDNTNLSAWEPKKYVEAALKYGYKVEFVDVGTGGCTVDELHKRNVHDVPKEAIQRMVDKYTAEGPLTIEKVLKSTPPKEI